MMTPQTWIGDLLDLPLRHGAYWLHADGWYRLYPPAYNPHSFESFDPAI